MNQAGIQAKIWAGAAMAALRLGASASWYRPNGAGAAIASGNLQGTIQVAVSTDATFTFSKPAAYGKPENWYGLFSGASVIVGDYFVHPEGTFFAAALDPILPPRLVRCNQVVTFTRPGAPTPGADYYGGATMPDEAALFGPWPGAVTQGTKGDAGEMKLPGDTRLGWVSILVPSVSGVQVRSGDVVTDAQALPQRYTISAVESTSLGYRITAALAAS